MNQKLTRTFYLYILLFVLASLAFVTAADQAPEGIDVSLAVEGSGFTVGDIIPITLKVIHPAGFRVIPLQLETGWGELEVREISLPQVTVAADGSEITTQTIMITKWTPGEYATPELPIKVSNTAGEIYEVSAMPLSLQVNSVLIDGDSALRDIKPQAELPIPPAWPWVVGGLLAAVFVLAAWIWFLRRRSAKRAAAASHETRLPHEVALDELNRIEDLNLPEQGHYKEYYTLTSDVLRQYLEESFHIPTLDRTTREISRSLKFAPFTRVDKTNLINLLRDADLVKFAKIRPEITQARTYIPRMRHTVVSTMPPEIAKNNGNGNKDENIRSLAEETPMMEIEG